MSGRTGSARWRWRGTVALAAVALGFVIYPLIEGSDDVINSDWPAFATGGRLIIENPSHLYDMDTQRRIQLEVTGGRTLVTLGVNGILPFLAPAWVAFLAVPFDLLGTNLGGRLWILVGLACLAIGLYLAVRPRPPTSILPAFASVPTALLLLNAQLDGFVALGIGAAMALWTQPFLAGLCLGLTLLKPQLVLPLAAALLLTRQWRVLAGWAVAGVVLLAATAALNPHWPFEWLSAAGGTVQAGAREIDLAHIGILLPRAYQGGAVAFLSLMALAVVLWLARRRRDDMRAATAVLIAGGVLVAPHSLPTDLVLVSVALALWGEAQWQDWLLLSAGAAIAAVVPAPWPTAVGVLVVGWLCLRAAGVIAWRREPAPASAG
ncbi:MAG TPA: glycosyltransferase family 87 protein [Candidatus Dormibacteraeota bacterium]